MTARKAATYGTGAALLVAYLAAANLPSQESDRPERDARPAATVGTESLATEVGSQAARLRTRMTQAPVPDNHPRNPFAFGAARRALPAAEPAARAAVAPEPTPVVPPLPVLTLMGIAEETLPAGPRRTAVIGGDRDTIYMVTEGEPVGDRYKVTKIGVDAVELEDVVTHGYRRIALR